MTLGWRHGSSLLSFHATFILPNIHLAKPLLSFCRYSLNQAHFGQTP